MGHALPHQGCACKPSWQEWIRRWQWWVPISIVTDDATYWAYLPLFQVFLIDNHECIQAFHTCWITVEGCSHCCLRSSTLQSCMVVLQSQFHMCMANADLRSSAAADGQALAAQHAMRLVRQGALRAAAILGEALAAVGAHLPDLVAAHACMPTQAKQPTGLDCLAGDHCTSCGSP